MFKCNRFAYHSRKNEENEKDLSGLLKVFLEGNDAGAFTFALKPVVSDPIYDKSKFK